MLLLIYRVEGTRCARNLNASAAAVGHNGGRYQTDACQHHWRWHLRADNGSHQRRQNLTFSLWEAFGRAEVLKLW